MTNSVELESRRIVSYGHDDAMNIIEQACSHLEQNSDCVGCPAARPDSHRISTRTIAIGALLVALFASPLIPIWGTVDVAKAFRGPAVAINEAQIVNPEVRLGNPLIVRLKSKYLRPCNWQWVREWYRDGRPVARNTTQGSAHIIGVINEHEIAIDLPTGISPGNYVLNMSGVGACDHGEVAQIIDAPMSFRVTN